LNNRLADELIRISEDRPESWVAMTHYSIMKNDLESAMAFIDRVNNSKKKKKKKKIVVSILISIINYLFKLYNGENMIKTKH